MQVTYSRDRPANIRSGKLAFEKRMQNLIIQNYTSSDLAKLTRFSGKYLEKYPDAKLNDPEFYTYNPVLKDGENVYCVYNSDHHVVGFAPLFPVITTDENLVTGPHDIWTIILAHPDNDKAEDIRNLLLGAVINKVKKIKSIYGLSRIRLAADMMISQEVDIDYLQRKGFETVERIYVMSYEISQAIPTIAVPTEITFRQLKLESEAEQMAYLEVHNSCFPKNPKTIEALQFLLQSPLWETGTVIAAYSPLDKLIGSVLVYCDEQKGYGVTDDVMVVPDWRGQNIAKYLISEGLRYFQAKGIFEVRLEVLVNNLPAVSVYKAMGFGVINQEIILGKTV